MTKYNKYYSYQFPFILCIFAVATSYLFERIQENISCAGTTNCTVWGSFVYFIILNTTISFALGYWYKTRVSKSKSAKFWFKVMCVLAPIVTITFLIATPLYFQTYAKSNQNSIELHYYGWIPSSTVKPGIYTISYNKIKHIFRLWHYTGSGKGTVGCSSQDYLVLKDESRYYINDFNKGWFRNTSFIAFLAYEKNIPIVNQSQQPTMICP